MAYREERHSLEQRLASLEKELADVRARASELSELQKSEARLSGEVESLQRTLRDLEAGRRRLPTLESIRIASPCSARWEEMIGDERVRFCTHCAKNVYNLSAMPRAEAEALLVEKEGQLCARLYQRKDGTVLTADCPVGVRAKRVKRIAAFAIAGGTLAAIAATMVTMGKSARMGSARVATTGELAPSVPVPVMGEPVPEPMTHTLGVVAPHPAPPPPSPSATTSPRSAGAK
jgi:hypothetical protein